MIIHKGFESVTFRKPVVAMGIFDGVHLGHVALLKHLVDKATTLRCESVVVTFTYSQLPVTVNDIKRNLCLTTADEKRELLRQTGIDHLVETELDSELKKMEAAGFIRDILYDRFAASHIITGYDQRFGKNDEGNFEMLKLYAPDFGFTVEQAPEVRPAGNRVSSSVIKRLLLTGDIGMANMLLGYCYKVSGTVIDGKKKGRTIGFPTANILPAANKLIPRGGVYAVEVNTGSGHFCGMLNIGTNPTVDTANRKQSIEVNIIGFNGDIYNRDVVVTFRKRLRDERRFDSMEQLALQIKLDMEEALRVI
ncbi:MAG: bifunctional riboflavin kinase/FAD synthetase [Bacteroidales bacterium]|jgi:riboflavin kinase/FMN adenylyltransferase|nr:bifunctional riboflavin kinase/FAD synthetase [Bacteroidales bacterium]